MSDEYLVYTPSNPTEMFENEEEAIAYAQEHINYFAEEADEGWDHAVEEIRVCKVIKKAKLFDVKDYDDEENKEITYVDCKLFEICNTELNKCTSVVWRDVKKEQPDKIDPCLAIVIDEITKNVFIHPSYLFYLPETKSWENFETKITGVIAWCYWADLIKTIPVNFLSR